MKQQKLVYEDIKNITKLLESGKYTQVDIAKMYNVSKATINLIKSGKRYKLASSYLKDGINVEIKDPLDLLMVDCDICGKEIFLKESKGFDSPEEWFCCITHTDEEVKNHMNSK